MERVSVPSSYGYMSGDLAIRHRVSALLRGEGDALVLEFRRKSNDFGAGTEGVTHDLGEGDLL